jgi:hypothetical protein
MRPMSNHLEPYFHLRDALSQEDLGFLRDRCKQHLADARIPAYVLLDHLHAPAYLKIQSAMERMVGTPLYYLNDFYIYTDSSFKTGWHVDTELFTFENAYNAWILLSPAFIDDPLCFVAGVNESLSPMYHSLTERDGDYVLGDYSGGDEVVRSIESIESAALHTPRVGLGDILAFDAKRFHRTNGDAPKHAISLKFVARGVKGFLSQVQVDPFFWPEIETFNRLVGSTRDWQHVLDGLRNALRTEDGRKTLSAGFYPEKFELYRKMSSSL